jgi:SAM-dependent methyltransferase
MSAFDDLYDRIAERKGEQNSVSPYTGGNGRIDRAVDLIRSGALGRFERPAALLDVGGATGNLGYALRNMFAHREVVDISVRCEGPARAKGNHFHCVNVDESGLSHIDNDEIDLITALDFIEHIIDPEKFARECLRVLRPGGVVLINTPNMQHWRHLHSLVVDGVFPHTSGDQEVYHGGHVAFFNLQDMDDIFVRRTRFTDSMMHTQGLPADPPPPIWGSLSSLPPHTKMKQLSYADLIYSCRKPV